MTKRLVIAISLAASPLLAQTPLANLTNPAAFILLILLVCSFDHDKSLLQKTSFAAPVLLTHTYLLSHTSDPLWLVQPIALALCAALVILKLHSQEREDHGYRKKAAMLEGSLKNNDALKELLLRAGQKETVTDAAQEIALTLSHRYEYDYVTILLATKRKQLVLKGTTAPKVQVKTIELMAENHLKSLQEKQGKALVTTKKSCAKCPNASKRGVAYSFFIPFMEQDRLVGAVLVENKEDKAMENTVEEGFFTLIVNNIHLIIKNTTYQEELLRRAMTDHLTGAYNRSYLDTILPRKLAEYHGTGKSFVVAMLDIDHFKAFNDTYGHAFGDLVLKEFAAFFQQSIRADANGDIFFRYGGEEFTMFLADVDAATIFNRMDQLCQQLSSLTFADDKGMASSITVSIGLAQYPDHGSTTQSLLEKADKALYQAKQEGRNRLVVYQPPAVSKAV